LNNTLTIKNIKWNNNIITIDTLLQNIIIIDHDNSSSMENKNQKNLLPLIPKIPFQPTLTKETIKINTEIKTKLTNSIDLLDQLEEADKTKLIDMISKGNKLSAFFFSSNLTSKNSKKNTIQENFELIWENFSI
jgi:hypothetical protein